MDYWTNDALWRERRRELLREAQERHLVGEARKARKIREASVLTKKKRPGAVEVRWGLLEDEANVAELLELNGMPRWVAFEERFVVAERDGAVLAAVCYRTEPKRLRLGLLVADPWAGERSLAVSLYAGARKLAVELGVGDIVARIDQGRAAYLHEAGYYRWGGGWRMDLSRPVERHGGLSAGGWRGRIASMDALVRAFLPRKKVRPENVVREERCESKE